MADIYSIPPAELRKPLLDPADVIADELRMYPDTDGFIQCYIGLSAIYGPTKMGTSFLKASRILLLSYMQENNIGSEDIKLARRVDTEFYAGSILALHSSVRVLQSDRRRMLYDCTSGNFETDGLPPDQATAVMTEALNDMAAYRQSIWGDEFYELLSTDLQDVVYEAGDRLVAGNDQSSSEELKFGIDNFMAGYTYGARTVVEVLQLPIGTHGLM